MAFPDLSSFYIPTTPKVVRSLRRKLIWRIPTDRQELFLTFDDGPTPEVTPFVLDQLREYGAKGTFFCIGAKVRKYPELYRRILEEGHAVGNHTDQHLNGKKITEKQYFRSISACSEVVESNLFRPPYGRLTRSQSKALQEWFHIIMWDVLSADFDQRLSGQKCAAHVTDNVKPGSIVVFHDSEKAWDRLKVALPETLKHFQEKGYAFQELGGVLG